MSREIAEKIKIKIPSEWVTSLSEEFGCSKRSIYNALNYSNNSDKALAIRMKVKELLEAEALKIND